MTAPVVQIKRGALLNLPGLRAGEPAFTTDSFDFYVGLNSTTGGNKFVGSHRYWSKETASKGSGVNLVESTGGSDFITLAAPASVGAAVTYYFPATQGINGTVLTNDGSGNLSWGSGSNNATFSGITTFSDTTDSTNKDNGAVIIEGGVGIEKSVNIGGNLTVTGTTNITGALTGTISTATRALSVDVVGVATNKDYYITLVDASGTAQSLGVDAELLYNPNTNTFKVGTGVGITQFSSAVGSGNSVSSVPTSQAIIDYVTSFDMDDDLSVAGDTGGTLTIDFDTETLTIAGTPNEIETVGAGNSITIGLPDTVNITTALDVPTVEATNLKARDGTTAITISNSTGAVGFANSVTVSGDLYVLGNTTQVETSELKVEDTLIDLGLVNVNDVLVPPSSDLNLDVGMLMNWYDGSAKKASVFWDDSAQRIGIASDVTESTGVLTVNNWAAVEIGALWVNDCAGQSQVISCTTGERFLNNITVDAGIF